MATYIPIVSPLLHAIRVILEWRGHYLRYFIEWLWHYVGPFLDPIVNYIHGDGLVILPRWNCFCSRWAS